MINTIAILCFRLAVWVVYLIGTSLYFRSKRASRSLYVWNFAASIAVLGYSFLDLSTVTESFSLESRLSHAVLWLTGLGVFGFYCYRLKSLGTFLLFAGGLGCMLVPLYLDDYLRGRGMSRESLSLLTDVMFAMFFVLVTSAAIQGFRTYFRHRDGAG